MSNQTETINVTETKSKETTMKNETMKSAMMNATAVGQTHESQVSQMYREELASDREQEGAIFVDLFVKTLNGIKTKERGVYQQVLWGLAARSCWYAVNKTLENYKIIPNTRGVLSKKQRDFKTNLERHVISSVCIWEYLMHTHHFDAGDLMASLTKQLEYLEDDGDMDFNPTPIDEDARARMIRAGEDAETIDASQEIRELRLKGTFDRRQVLINQHLAVIKSEMAQHYKDAFMGNAISMASITPMVAISMLRKIDIVVDNERQAQKDILLGISTYKVNPSKADLDEAESTLFLINTDIQPFVNKFVVKGEAKYEELTQRQNNMSNDPQDQDLGRTFGSGEMPEITF